MTISTIGLIIDIIGAILLFISAEKLNKEILYLMRNPSDRSDAVEGISYNELKNLSKLNGVSRI